MRGPGRPDSSTSGGLANLAPQGTELGVSPIQQQANQNLEKYRVERAKFIELIREQEAMAAKDPDGYRRRVVRYAWLGYLYVIGMLLLLLGLLVGVVYLLFTVRGGSAALLKFGIILVPVVFVVIRSLFVKIEKPTGPTLTRQEAPKLWAEVDEMSAALGAPKIDEIIFEMDMNAAAAQVPRIGLLGFYRNYLLLGLPLMMTLSKDEMKSVIAHEFGHFSGQHGRTGGWIYKLNQTYANIRSAMNAQGGGLLFASFFNWFQPRFDALSFALRRQNEYAADAAAARLAGAESAARALTKLSYLSELMDKAMWDPLNQRFKAEPTVPGDAYQFLGQRLRDALPEVDATALVRRSFSETTSYDDTHPSLTDRLSSLGQLSRVQNDVSVDDLVKPPAESAADYYIGASLEKLLVQFNREFAEHFAEYWKHLHTTHQTDVADLEKLEAKPDRNHEEEMELAFLVLRMKDASLALPMFQKMVQDRPEDADALYGLGEALLKLGNRDGETYLRDSFRLNTSYLEGATRLIAEYRAEHGDAAELDQLKEEYYEQLHLVQAVEQAKLSINLGDDYAESTYSDEDRRKVVEMLEGKKNIKRVWIVAKVIPAEVVQRADVMIVEPTKVFVTSGDRTTKILTSLTDEATYPKPVTILIVEKGKPWEKRLAGIPKALVYERS